MLQVAAAQSALPVKMGKKDKDIARIPKINNPPKNIPIAITDIRDFVVIAPPKRSTM